MILYMSGTVDKIKQKLNIVDVVGSYITLKKAGIHQKGLCPFHNEKSPSFTVSQERNSYYCFGCGAKGDVFTFIQEYEGVDFKQALAMLADKAGVDMSQEKFAPTKKIDKDLYGVLQMAERYYVSVLHTNQDATEYLTQRGLNSETIKEWGVGYAKDEWRGVYDFLSEKGVTAEQMLAVGLIKKKDNGGFYDVFRGRIMFPIKDILGRVVGFTGRILVARDDAPKYLNTPETDVFNKSEILYGLDKAKPAVRKQDYVILVEGQMDVVMSHQAGIKNAVASSGTAFTVDHLSKLSPMTKRILMAFDGDEAGINAMKRSGLLALKAGFDVKILGMSGMKDTADMVKEDPQIWVDAIKHSKPIIDLLINQLFEEKSERRVQIKKIKTDILPFVESLKNTMEQSHYIKKIAELFAVTEESVWSELKSDGSKPEIYIDQMKEDNPGEKQAQSASVQRERSIIGALFLLEEKPDIFGKDQRIKERIIEACGEEKTEELIQKYEGQKEELIFEAEDLYIHPEETFRPTTLINEFIVSLEVEYIDKTLYTLKQDIKTAELKGEGERLEKFFNIYNEKIERKHKLLAGNK